MFQIDTEFRIFKLVFLPLFFVMVFSSCSKKQSSTRAAVKTQQTQLNPAQTSSADQQAASVQANYKIASISVPESTGSGFLVYVELTSPNGSPLSLTTRHENGVLDSDGVYTDSQRGLQVYVLSRCSQDDCSKYTILVTTYKSNQALYQDAAVSYKHDCKFNRVSASYSIGSFIYNLNDAEYKFNVTPMNDCPVE